MQSVSCRIWTCVAVSIFNDDNHYTTGTSKYLGNTIELIWQLFVGTQYNSFNYSKGLSSFIWLIEGTLTDISTSGVSRPGSNVNNWFEYNWFTVIWPEVFLSNTNNF